MLSQLLEKIERADRVKLFDVQPQPVAKFYTGSGIESVNLSTENYEAILAHLRANGWQLAPQVTSKGYTANRVTYTHNITVSRDKDSMTRWQGFLSGKGVPCQVRPHPVFGWGLYTNQAHINIASMLKEQYGQLTNVLTGEIKREGI